MKKGMLIVILLVGGTAFGQDIIKVGYKCTASCKYDIVSRLTIHTIGLDPSWRPESEVMATRGSAETLINTECSNSCGRSKRVGGDRFHAVFETWDHCRITYCACEKHTWKVRDTNPTHYGDPMYREVENSRQVTEVPCNLPIYE